MRDGSLRESIEVFDDDSVSSREVGGVRVGKTSRASKPYVEIDGQHESSFSGLSQDRDLTVNKIEKVDNLQTMSYTSHTTPSVSVDESVSNPGPVW